MAFGIGSKIKKGLGSIANKVADKLIPKELAPFLPMLAPLFMGPGAGLMSRYLVPQLLTALSTGKTTGGISGTSQGLAGLASFLSDPTLYLEQPVKFEKASTALIERQSQLKILEDEWLILEEKASNFSEN